MRPWRHLTSLVMSLRSTCALRRERRRARVRDLPGSSRGHCSALEVLYKHEKVDASRWRLWPQLRRGSASPRRAPTRIAACISSGGWGHGEKKFRKQHASPEAWQRFTSMMEEGRRRAKRGESMKVPRFDIVPIRPELRGNLAPGSILEFPFEVVESMYAFTANEVVGKIAPRRCCLLIRRRHGAPTEQSIDLFLPGPPTDLHLFADVDHFLSATATRWCIPPCATGRALLPV